MHPGMGASQLCHKLFNRSSDFKAHHTLHLDSLRGPKMAKAVILGVIFSLLGPQDINKDISLAISLGWAKVWAASVSLIITSLFSSLLLGLLSYWIAHL